MYVVQFRSYRTKIFVLLQFRSRSSRQVTKRINTPARCPLSSLEQLTVFQVHRSFPNQQHSLIMQFKFLTVAALASLAAATPLEVRQTNQCNTGSLQCCQSVQSADSSTASSLLGLLGVVIGEVTAQVGITCTPISVIGVGGNSCTAQPVCCTNNSFNGVVALGCTPINLSL
ncbi:hypothetical protein D9758_010072 [Tetrapyrgos nigripes]|uniref:Hydrophobin n=1 Tax=Tetrapyrgos nigripes TaxID=182062 RepID=A0A8H5FSZ6_9AGAR|nr:hypothetical protein D9758_010072 [Tetrapyrgos nigripes]